MKNVDAVNKLNEQDDCVYEWDEEDDKDQDGEGGTVLVVWTMKKKDHKAKNAVLEQKLWSNKEPTSITFDPKDTIVHAWCGPGKGEF